MTKTTVTNIQPQDTVIAGYTRRGHFMGDLNRVEKFTVGDAEFGTLRAVKAYLGKTKMIDLESEANARGTSVRVHFWNYAEAYAWDAYIWGGSFRVGSSADRLQLKAV
jgi:hypothetical protein